MDGAWYEREDVRERLIVFGRGIQGKDPYDVIIEPDRAKCQTGFCSFALRKIIVCPTLFPVPDAEQYVLTKALLVHEAAHRRHTTPATLPTIAREIANILEDERVESRMCDEFMGLRWLIERLAGQFYRQARPIDEASDESREVVTYFLQLRWARRTGQDVKGVLSPGNQLLWEQIEPLVYESWRAEHSEMVNRNALKIAEVLGFHNSSSQSSTANNSRKEEM